MVEMIQDANLLGPQGKEIANLFTTISIWK